MVLAGDNLVLIAEPNRHIASWKDLVHTLNARFLRWAAAWSTALLCLSEPAASFADNHLPIVDKQPVATFAGAGQARATPASSFINGNVNIAGTAMITIAKGISASYNRIVNGVHHNNFDQVIIPGLGSYSRAAIMTLSNSTGSTSSFADSPL